ncbi:MAG: sulfatase [Phycisphaerae bacterium]|jgi:arylsulfatase A-like enzyme
MTFTPTLTRAWTACGAWLAGLAIVSLLTGCDRSSAPPVPAPGMAASVPTAPAPLVPDADLPNPTTNVVLYLIDTLRADRLGCYGYARPTTPNIDALARESVLFEHAHAPAPWTLPSVPSILTSTFLCEHGVVVEGQKISPNLYTLAERLRLAGYHTASMYVNDFAGPVTGLDRGYDVCQKFQEVVDAADVESWLRGRPDKPFLLYVHNIEPHNPFNASEQAARKFAKVPEARRERLSRMLGYYRRFLRLKHTGEGRARHRDTTRQQEALLAGMREAEDDFSDLYDAVVYEADERLGRIIGTLKRWSLWDDTLLIVLSDHGEELADHGAFLHSQSVYQELAAVPLIVKFPRGEFSGKRVSTVISLIDVLPSIFDYFGRMDLAAGARGRSLMPLIRGEDDRRDAPIVVTTVRENRTKYFRPWAETRGERNIALRTIDGEWKGIWNVDLNTFELYNLFQDPREQDNLAESNPELLEAMFTVARPWYEQCLAGRQQGEQTPLEQIDPAVLKNLAQLGYVDAPGGEPDVSEDFERWRKESENGKRP